MLIIYKYTYICMYDKSESIKENDNLKRSL